jgi:group II intron reverse transcriptase/maturase
VGIQRKKVSWILDADIRSFFDTLNHEWLVKFIEHRIADPRVIRHIKKWLNAGVLEKGELLEQAEGVPQGGSVSPLLANIYLHYVLDLWAEQWRRKHARGEMIIVRYADDFVIGFQHETEAKRFLEELKERFRRFDLELHAQKTRIIEFGRFAAERREKRGEGKPATFNFLGFTHLCDKTRQGKFVVGRHTMAKRMHAKLKTLKEALAKRKHQAIAETGAWLGSVVRGHCRYYGLPRNYRALDTFRDRVRRLWQRALSRRSQKGRMTESRMKRIAERWLPKPCICHPYPEVRLAGCNPR